MFSVNLTSVYWIRIFVFVAKVFDLFNVLYVSLQLDKDRDDTYLFTVVYCYLLGTCVILILGSNLIFLSFTFYHCVIGASLDDL